MLAAEARSASPNLRMSSAHAAKSQSVRSSRSGARMLLASRGNAVASPISAAHIADRALTNLIISGAVASRAGLRASAAARSSGTRTCPPKRARARFAGALPAMLKYPIGGPGSRRQVGRRLTNARALLL